MRTSHVLKCQHLRKKKEIILNVSCNLGKYRPYITFSFQQQIQFYKAFYISINLLNTQYYNLYCTISKSKVLESITFIMSDDQQCSTNW